MSLLHSRWEHYSADRRRLIGQRILDGPPRADDEDETRRQATVASCLGWLIQNDCALPDDLVEPMEDPEGQRARMGRQLGRRCGGDAGGSDQRRGDKRRRFGVGGGAGRRTSWRCHWNILDALLRLS